MSERIMRRREVEHRIGLRRSAIYKLIAENRFPKPIPLGPHAVGWIESHIDDWIVERTKAARDASSR